MFPQRQRFPRFGAVAVVRFPVTPVFTVLQGGFTVRRDSTTAAFPAIRCRCGSTFPCHPRLHGAPRRLNGQAGFHNGSVSRDSVPLWHTVVRRARLRRSHFAMSNMSQNLSHLLSKTYVSTICRTRQISPPNGHSAPYLHKSSMCLFSEYLIIRYFYKHTLLAS